MDIGDESMWIFKENKSFCSCAREKEKDLSCNCGESEQDPAWRWDENSKTTTAIVSHNCQQVYFHKGYSVGNACIRGDTPMVAGYDYYWEIKMLSSVYGTSMMIGIGTDFFNVNQSNNLFCNLLGSDSESWGMMFDGKLYHNNQSSTYHSVAGFTIGSIIGVHLNMWNGTLEFYLNRIPLGIAFGGLKNKILYPLLSSTAAHTIMKLVYAHSEPYSLSLLSLKSLNVPCIGSLPPGLKAYSKNCWWWFPKSSRLKSDSIKKVENSAPLRGIFVLTDTDDDEEEETGCNLLAQRMKRVLENSKRSLIGRPECSQESRHSHSSSHGRFIRVYRHRFRPWMDFKHKGNLYYIGPE